MPLETLPFRIPAERRHAIPVTVAHLDANGLLAYPTETVYGFGCALRPTALERLARLKRRTPDRPFLLLVRGRTDLSGLRWSAAAGRLADAFWPGPLTLALPADTAHLPAEIVGPDRTVAIRATAHEGIRALLSEMAGPITSTSANAPGTPPATTAAGAAQAFSALDVTDALVLDGGSLAPSAPSTLVSCAAPRPRILRAGAIPIAALRRVVPDIDV
ncbi:MAG: L-threonylcarbamoyladenylate synthase [Longimicrobiales bacterium]